MVSVILLQAGKGGGLAETFGGGGGSQMTIFGQKASAFLTKATTVSAVLFLCTSLSLAVLSSRRQKSLMEGANITQPQRTALPGDITDPIEGVRQATKTTIKHIEIDPITGEETVIEERVLSSEGPVKSIENETVSDVTLPEELPPWEAE